MIKIGQIINGFEVRDIHPVPELDMVAYRMSHQKSGADLLWLSCQDDNRAFSIAFKTLPENSTGVFHILEHSVLCGSDKYPLKEPFVDLLKGSLQTFLNAMTFPDKTMYPLATTNAKDYMNLMDVYMDAVLHPRIHSMPEIFMQEGWHYEFPDGETPAKFNGVVYNEMKGVYSSPDSVLDSTTQHLMFPDNCYGYSSGGDPAVIPSLTYHDFIETHKRFYHPSNSYICLYGDLDIDAVLAHLDSAYLSHYDRIDPAHTIRKQAAFGDRVAHEQYELGEGESVDHNTLIGYSAHLCDFDDRKTQLAMSILLDALTSTNEAPLKKAILDAGLGDEFNAWVNDQVYQPYVSFVMKKTDADRADAYVSLLKRTLAELADKGIDRELLTATLNRVEFNYRELNFGMPQGVVLAVNVMSTWLYGGNPVDMLENREILKQIRADMQNGYFEDLIRRCLLSSERTLTLVLEPSLKKAGERMAAEQASVDAFSKNLNDKTRQEIKASNDKLVAFQSSQDTDEARKCLPHLERSDIRREVTEYSTETHEAGGAPVLYHDLSTNGITYLRLYFNLSAFPVEEAKYFSLLSNLLFETATAAHTTQAFKNQIMTDLGELSASMDGYVPVSGDADYVPMLTVSASCLEENLPKAKALILEGLNDSLLRPDEVRLNVRQLLAQQEAMLIQRGNLYAIRRAGSRVSCRFLYDDETDGIAYLSFLRRLASAPDAEFAEVCGRMRDLLQDTVSGGSVTVSFTGARNSFEEYCKDPLVFPHIGENKKHAPIVLSGRTEESLKIPGAVSYSAIVGCIPDAKNAYHGQMAVLSSILSLDYLWNRVRVQGGAYGVGISVTKSGTVLFYSFRDPHITRTLQAFRDSVSYLRDFDVTESEMTKYVIGTFSNLDAPLRPKQAGSVADIRYLSGVDTARLQKERDEILRTSVSDIRACADLIDSAIADGSVCVVGGASLIDSEAGDYQTIQ